MATLTNKDRKRLADSQFALPAQRKYPIPDAAHARDALARAAQDASPHEKAVIRRNVHRLFPHIKIGS